MVGGGGGGWAIHTDPPRKMSKIMRTLIIVSVRTYATYVNYRNLHVLSNPSTLLLIIMNAKFSM